MLLRYSWWHTTNLSLYSHIKNLNLWSILLLSFWMATSSLFVFRHNNTNAVYLQTNAWHKQHFSLYNLLCCLICVTLYMLHFMPSKTNICVPAKVNIILSWIILFSIYIIQSSREPHTYKIYKCARCVCVFLN